MYLNQVVLVLHIDIISNFPFQSIVPYMVHCKHSIHNFMGILIVILPLIYGLLHSPTQVTMRTYWTGFQHSHTHNLCTIAPSHSSAAFSSPLRRLTGISCSSTTSFCVSELCTFVRYIYTLDSRESIFTRPIPQRLCRLDVVLMVFPQVCNAMP